jgi:hypothetical protein
VITWTRGIVFLALAHVGAQGCSRAHESTVVATPSAIPPGGPLKSQLLAAHNAHRARHCAPPLQWSAQLARAAEGWAHELVRRGCPLEHSQLAHGENLAAGTQGGFAPGDFVDMWYREVGGYRFKRGRFSMSTGHFTQLIWRDTRRVGCALGACDNGLELLVCEYDPPGNVEGRFEANVLPTSCK